MAAMRLLPLPLAASLAVMALPAVAQAEGLALRYDVYAGGSLAVVMETELAIGPEGYRIGTGMELAGLYSVFADWDMQASASGLLADGLILPLAFNKQSEGGTRWATLRYNDGAISQARGNPPPESEDTSAVSAAIKETAVDPLSGVVAVLHRMGETGQCAGTMHLYDGKTYFRVTSTDQGAAVAPDSRYGSYAGPAQLCVVTVDDSAAYGRTDSDPRTAAVWLAQPVPNAPFVPVRIETQSRFGAVRVHLSEFWVVAGETAQTR